jgi:hypothetical protein
VVGDALGGSPAGAAVSPEARERLTTAGDGKKPLSVAIVTLVSIGYLEGPYHTFWIEITGPPDQTPERLVTTSFVGERFGLKQPFRKLLSAPFTATFPGPGLYAFHILVDDNLAYQFEYPILRVEQLPAGWAKMESQSV